MKSFIKKFTLICVAITVILIFGALCIHSDAVPAAIFFAFLIWIIGVTLAFIFKLLGWFFDE